MSDFNTFDRVRTTRDLPPIPTGTLGTVMDATGIALDVKFDGDSSPGRLTPRDAVEKIDTAPMIPAVAPGAFDGNVPGEDVPQQPQFGEPQIMPAAGPSAAHTSIGNAIAGQVAVLFDDALVDLQVDGPLVGVWAGTISFPFSSPLQEDTIVVMDIRGGIEKTLDAAALVAIVIDGDAQERKFPFRRAKSGNYFWRIEKMLRRGAAMHTLLIVIAAERRSPEDLVLITIDSIDIVLQ